MASRGRGRGRGGFDRSILHAKQESIPLFPDNIELPDQKNVKDDRPALKWHQILDHYWKDSSYRIEEKTTKREEAFDIERYSDRGKRKKRWTKESASSYMKLEPGYFPLELLEGIKSRGKKKVNWKQNPDGKKVDIFEELEKNAKLKQKDKKNDGKSGEDEDDEDGNNENEDEDDRSSASTGGDYSQNEDFDDDEDDYNVDDGPDEEGDTY